MNRKPRRRERKTSKRAPSNTTTAPIAEAGHGQASATAVTISVEPISVEIGKAPELTGATRTRLFQAARDNELTVRKAGKQTLVEVDELKRWVRSLPMRGRQPEQPAASA